MQSRYGGGGGVVIYVCTTYTGKTSITFYIYIYVVRGGLYRYCDKRWTKYFLRAGRQELAESETKTTKGRDQI